MKEDLCKGCTSQTGLNLPCLLQVEYNNKICPCANCIVKMMCLKTYTSCKKYKRFCSPQIIHYLKPNVSPPCMNCRGYHKCLKVLHEMAEDYACREAVHDLYCFIEDHSGDLFCMFLYETEKTCDKLDKYFPAESATSYDLWPPDWRHVNFSINVWNYREHQLMNIFNTEKVLQKIIQRKMKKHMTPTFNKKGQWYEFSP